MKVLDSGLYENNKYGVAQRVLKSLTKLVADFQYHEGERLWPSLAVGQALNLVREADNSYDDRAVRVEWQGRKLGYIPRMDNAAVAQLLNRRGRLEAVIAGLRDSKSLGSG